MININRLLLHNNDCTCVAHRIMCPKKCIFWHPPERVKKTRSCGVPYRWLASLCPVRLIQFIRSLDQSIVLRPMFAHNVALADVTLSTHPIRILPAVFWVLNLGPPGPARAHLTNPAAEPHKVFILVRIKSFLGPQLMGCRCCTDLTVQARTRSTASIRFLSYRTKNIFGRSTTSCVLVRLRDFITSSHHVTTLAANLFRPALMVLEIQKCTHGRTGS